MILPPLVIDVHVRQEDSRRFRIWLPLFLLWPLLLPLVVFVLAVTILADVVCAIFGARYHYYTAFTLGVFHVFAELRGTRADIVTPDSLVHVVII